MKMLVLYLLLLMNFEKEAMGVENKESSILTSKKISVKVFEKKIPIENCVVSDGFDCGITDKNGTVFLEINERSEFVFISLPSGYKLKEKSSFFQKLTNIKEEYFFEIEKDNSNQKSFKFITIGDPQILDDEDFLRFEKESFTFIKNFVKKNKPTFGVVLGDVAYDDLRIFSKYSSLMNQLPVMFFHVVGNHDIDTNVNCNNNSKKEFKKYFGPSYYSFNVGEIHFIVLDNVYWENKDYKGYVSDEQLKWMQKNLSFIEKNKTVILLMHIPPVSDFAERLNISAKEKFFVENMNKVYELLKGFDFYIITGHLHENYLIENNGIKIFCVGSIGGAWWTSDICCDGSPNGVGVFEIDERNLKYRYIGNGLDEKERFWYYVSDKNEESKELMLNCWDIFEKVSVIGEDEKKNEYRFERFTGFDKKSAQLYSDASKYKHKWIKPYLTHHLYKATIPQEVNKLKIFFVEDGNRSFIKEINLSNTK